MVPGVDRLQEWVEVLGRPAIEGGRHQDNPMRPARKPVLKRLVPARRLGPEDEGVGLPVAGLEQVEQPLADRVGVGVVLAGHHDDQDLAVGDRLAQGRQVERVDPVVAFRRS
jgi:hypothetical protein